MVLHVEKKYVLLHIGIFIKPLKVSMPYKSLINKKEKLARWKLLAVECARLVRRQYTEHSYQWLTFQMEEHLIMKSAEAASS